MKRLYADIHRKIGGFALDVLIDSDASRIGILGESGSGKSMTLKSIAGIEAVDSGHIEADGRVLYDSSDKIDLKPQKRNVGYMFQNYALFPTMTLRSESEIRGTLRFLPQLEIRPSSNAPNPVESREAPPTSSFPDFSEPP